MKKKTFMSISIDAENASDPNLNSLMVITLKNLETEGISSNNKGHLLKSHS